MFSHHDHHFSAQFHKLLNEKMSKIYIFQSVIAFVQSLLGVFVPIYLYSLGFNLTQIFIYVIGTSTTYLLLIPIVVSFIKKFGFKYSILLSIPFYFLYIWNLNYVENSIIFFHLVWFTFGLYLSFFWPAFHSEIAVNGHSNKRGNELGTIQIIIMLMGSVAPFIGGYFLGFLNYTFLVILSSIILLIGSFPLLISKDIKISHYNFGYLDYIKLGKKPILRENSTPYRAEGIQTEMIMTIWPIILYLILDENFFYIGTLYTIISFISIAILIYLKKKVDRKDKKKLLKKVSYFLSTNWLLRVIALFTGGIFLYAVETMYKITFSLFSISFFPMFYNKAKKAGYMNTIVYREWCLHTTKIFISILGIIAFSLFENIYAVFGIFILFAIIASIKVGNFNEK